VLSAAATPHHATDTWIEAAAAHRMARLIRWCLLSAAFAGCGATWPHVIEVPPAAGSATRRGEWIGTYDEALASIVAVMVEDLRLPAPAATVYFHRHSEDFRSALELEGYDPALARETAAALTAVSGHKRVLVNDATMEEQPWPVRIALLAHELTHTLQYEYSGGSRGTSDQWLREGFAEWVEVEVLVRLGFTTRQQAQRIVLGRLRDVGVDRLPALSEMITFPDWVAVVARSNQEAVYGHAMLATEFLLEQTGVDAAIAYFKLFAASSDRIENFERAFGRSLGEFDKAWRARQESLTR
jgi:hypothetical protein